MYETLIRIKKYKRLRKMLMERRSFSRLKIEIPALLIKNGEELDVLITDICEQGISFKSLQKMSGGLKVDDLISIEFFDSFTVGNQEENKVLICRAKIRHIEQIENSDKISVGCYIYNQEFMEYATKRKFAEYFKNRRA